MNDHAAKAFTLNRLLIIITTFGVLGFFINPAVSFAASTPAVPGNLIPNAQMLLATVSTSTPDGWSLGGWDASSTFTYPVTGPQSDDLAIKVDVSSITDGAADWYFTPDIIATPSATYAFTDWYNSTAPSDLIVRWTLTGTSTYEYDAIATLPATSGWVETPQEILTVPSNATSFVVYHDIRSVGTLITSNYALVPYSSSIPGALSQGIVSLSFDDGWTSQYTNALPVLKADNLPATFYIISKEVKSGSNDPGYMNASQVLALQTAGNEIGAHTVDHCDLIQLYNDPASAMTGACASNLSTSTTAVSEIDNSRTELQSIGIDPVSFAYPYGTYNPSIESLVSGDGFSSARSVDVGYNTKQADPFALKGQSVDTTVSVSDIESWIDYAVTNKLWLILIFHQVDPNATSTNPDEVEGTTPVIFQQIADYIKASNVTVKTVGDALAYINGSTTPPTTVPISIVPSTLSSGMIGVPYDQVLTASTTASGPFTWTLASGALPLGLTFATTSTSAVVSGTPTTSGTSSFAVSVSSGSSVATENYSLFIDNSATTTPPVVPAVSIIPSVLSDGIVGAAYSQNLVASTTASGPFNWSLISGTLPSGLVLTTSSATATIAGTPTASGTSTFVIGVTNGSASTTQGYVLNITAAETSTTTPPAPEPSPAPSTGGGGGGGGSGYRTFTVLDFNTLMVNWGKTGMNIPGDFNGDGTVDILDFNQLLIHWAQ